MQNGKAIKCTFIQIRHRREALESTETPKNKKNPLTLKKN